VSVADPPPQGPAPPATPAEVDEAPRAELDPTPPFFGSWGRIYLAVLLSQVIVVVLLAILSEVSR